MSKRYEPSETASASDDLNDYDVISDTDPRSLESSVADLRLDSPALNPSAAASTSTWLSSAYNTPSHTHTRSVREPKVADDAKRLFETAGLSAEDIQANVQRTVVGPGKASVNSTVGRKGEKDRDRAMRVYVDGVFDFINVGNMHQLRQAKLAFPTVQLLVGPYTDIQLQAHAMLASLPHVERCELIRHIRWVDEIVFDAPVVLSEDFLTRHKIDYVAIEEGASVDPGVSKGRLSGYDLVKSIGKAISTRRTRNVTTALQPLATYEPAPKQSSPAQTLFAIEATAPPTQIPPHTSHEAGLDAESNACTGTAGLETPPEPREDFLV